MPCSVTYASACHQIYRIPIWNVQYLHRSIMTHWYVICVNCIRFRFNKIYSRSTNAIHFIKKERWMKLTFWIIFPIKHRQRHIETGTIVDIIGVGTAKTSNVLPPGFVVKPSVGLVLLIYISFMNWAKVWNQAQCIWFSLFFTS